LAVFFIDLRAVRFGRYACAFRVRLPAAVPIHPRYFRLLLRWNVGAYLFLSHAVISIAVKLGRGWCWLAVPLSLFGFAAHNAISPVGACLSVTGLGAGCRRVHPKYQP
jgi:hypothetical protein